MILRYAAAVSAAAAIRKAATDRAEYRLRQLCWDDLEHLKAMTGGAEPMEDH